ncbi:MAG: ExeM/NucH family extracellular endonuclease [Pelomonas sp.]|nr:ExeM/NucH family extracellular endonuclease [Roseateles sp.]
MQTRRRRAALLVAASAAAGGAAQAFEVAACAIPQIQGRGARGPLEGRRVTTHGVVTLVANSGFFMQDPIGDGDPSSSDGLFVYTGAQPTVRAGDAVQVTARVREYAVGASAASQAAPVTELTSVDQIAVLGRGNALPAPVEVDLLAEGGHLERLEGMLVRLRGPLTVQRNALLGRYGQLTLAAGTDRLPQPTQLVRPGAAANALAAANLARSIVLDDGSTVINPNPVPYLAADNTLRAGDQTDSITGVIDFGLADTSSSGQVSYKIQPTVTPKFARANPRSPRPDPVGGNLRLASANLNNFFSTFADGTSFDGQTGQGCSIGSPARVSKSNCRGAASLAEFTRQRAKVIAELNALNADVLGLMEVQNNRDITAQLVADGLNALQGAGSYALVPYPAQGTGTDAVRVAMLYKPARLRLVGPSLSNADPVNKRAPFAQGFVAPDGQRFAYVVNHLKSKAGCPSSGADADQGDQQGCWNATRVRQAQNLLGWLPTVAAAAGTGDVILVGDFNAYAREDPIDTLTRSGRVVDLAGRDDRSDYSYVHAAQAGRLDQAFGTPGVAARICGARSWHVNADEPALLDYRLAGKSVDAFTPTPYRASDHDPLVIGLGRPVRGGSRLGPCGSAD